MSLVHHLCWDSIDVMVFYTIHTHTHTHTNQLFTAERQRARDKGCISSFVLSLNWCQTKPWDPHFLCKYKAFKNQRLLEIFSYISPQKTQESTRKKIICSRVACCDRASVYLRVFLHVCINRIILYTEPHNASQDVSTCYEPNKSPLLYRRATTARHRLWEPEMCVKLVWIRQMLHQFIKEMV